MIENPENQQSIAIMESGMSGIKKKMQTKRARAAAVLLLGAALTVGASYTLAAEKNTRDVEDFVFGRAEAMLVAFNNTIISLSVDTERTAIDIAALTQRVGQLELKLAKMEKQLAAKD
jgi:SNF family Na+-dependent transporter